MADDSEAETPTPAGKTGQDKKAEGDKGGNGRNRLLTGAAIGIGSAALVAALLYANRARKSDRS